VCDAESVRAIGSKSNRAIEQATTRWGVGCSSNGRGACVASIDRSVDSRTTPGLDRIEQWASKKTIWVLIPSTSGHVGTTGRAGSQPQPEAEAEAEKADRPTDIHTCVIEDPGAN
jgi:hypothetical protein